MDFVFHGRYITNNARLLRIEHDICVPILVFHNFDDRYIIIKIGDHLENLFCHFNLTSE